MTETKQPCGNPECKTSTGIHDGLTFGSGELDDHGYWENPCFKCARAYEAANPSEEGWPFKGQEETLGRAVSRPGQQDGQGARPRADL